MIRIIILSLLMWSSSALAMVTIDGNLFYFSDNFVTDTTNTYARTFYDVALSMSLNKKGSVMLGWDYNSSTFNDNINTTTSAVSISGMGPKLLYYFDQNFHWSLGFTYDLILNGTNSVAGASAVKLQGTGMKFEAGYVSSVTDGIDLGVKLNYYMASFSDTITNGTTITDVSYHRSAFYPSICFIFRFQ